MTNKDANSLDSPNSKVAVSYSDYFVAFLDVLGFTDLVCHSKNIDGVSDYFTQAKRAFQTLDNIQSKKEIFRAAISDSIILALPADAAGRTPVENLRELCMAVQRIQWRMAQHNIWMRGAIARGDCWVDSKQLQVVGPAFIKAYNLEETARYPRVIIDPAIIPTLGLKSRYEAASAINIHPTTDANYAIGCVFDWTRLNMGIDIPFQDDTALFIDYLSPILTDGNQGTAQIIFENIEKSLFRHDTYEKFVWAKAYFTLLVNSGGGANHPHMAELEKLVYHASGK